MYDAHEVLRTFDDHTIAIVALSAIALIANYVWYGEMIRIARRDKVAACAPATTLLYLAHDGSYLVLFNHWFGGEYDHWFTKLFFVGIIVTFSLEVVMFSQTLRYGRAEYAPRLTQRHFVAAMLAALAAAVALWAATKSALGDDIYLFSFTAAIAWAVPFGAAQMLRRGDGSGTSVLTWASFTLIGTPWAICTIAFFGPNFQTVPWIALCLLCVIGGAVNTWFATHLRRRPTAATADAPRPVAVTA
ncbi:hypothetical protein [Mycobacterium sp.]|uniref:hypothetical protein n=1 Tax=Mycobacterium sp. TaxID=1785 RepID=UPI0011FCA0E5|nr:hypothetical protein [Mycobacterium sp.]TAM72043.1 MAG: hypothetical protein EPN51_04940 [Mycobacterium sp.]